VEITLALIPILFVVLLMGVVLIPLQLVVATTVVHPMKLAANHPTMRGAVTWHFQFAAALEATCVADLEERAVCGPQFLLKLTNLIVATQRREINAAEVFVVKLILEKVAVHQVIQLKGQNVAYLERDVVMERAMMPM